ncbi:MAG: rRNA pseudouridine synthase [Bacteroidetes bacterium]|nr:rRNA pseudouridine synthase [Bacteroidota bacterium]
MDIKIAKYLSECGVASRRKAEELIDNGKVKVNGKVMDNVAERINPDKDSVEVFGKKVSRQKLVYYILYKPVGYITTTEDRHADKIVTELVPEKPPVWPIGRLDKNTSGLLILTNDGNLTQEITHPKFKIQKEYEIITNSELDEKQITKIQKGVMLDDGFIKPNLFEKIEKNHYRMILSEGRNRIVRRIIEEIGKRVAQLKRTRVGNLRLEYIHIGSHKKISEKEIRKLLFN